MSRWPLGADEFEMAETPLRGPRSQRWLVLSEATAVTSSGRTQRSLEDTTPGRGRTSGQREKPTLKAPPCEAQLDAFLGSDSNTPASSLCGFWGVTEVASAPWTPVPSKVRGPLQTLSKGGEGRDDAQGCFPSPSPTEWALLSLLLIRTPLWARMFSDPQQPLLPFVTELSRTKP